MLTPISWLKGLCLPPPVLTDLSLQGTEWLLYGSPWRLEDNTETSNIKIISKVAGFSLVSYTPSLQDYGSAIIYNIGESGNERLEAVSQYPICCSFKRSESHQCPLIQVF